MGELYPRYSSMGCGRHITDRKIDGSIVQGEHPLSFCSTSSIKKAIKEAKKMSISDQDNDYEVWGQSLGNPDFFVLSRLLFVFRDGHELQSPIKDVERTGRKKPLCKMEWEPSWVLEKQENGLPKPFTLKPNMKTLDKGEPIVIEWDASPLNNADPIYYLREGLRSLYFLMKEIEISLIKTMKKNRSEGACHGMSTNYHNWFSVSLVDYLRMIKLADILDKNEIYNHGNWPEELSMIYKQKSVASKLNDYAKVVAPEVYLWRNKVGAHQDVSSAKNINKDISKAMMAFVNMATGTFEGGRYYVGTCQNSYNGYTPELKKWSLTKTFENLSGRFGLTCKL